jgi:ribosome biogenesis GTPase A
VTLETPDEFAAWLAEGKLADAERAVRKEAIEKNKKTAYKSNKR